MGTTALVAELLVVGFEVLVWVALLVSCLFGPEWLSLLGIAFDKAGIFTTAALIGLAYFFGIIIERVSDRLVRQWEKKIEASVEKMKNTNIGSRKVRVYSHYNEIVNQLEYMRSRRRILRASILNVGLIVLFAILYSWFHISVANQMKVGITVFSIVFGLCVITITIFGYKWITESYFLTLLQVNNYLDKLSMEKNTTQPKL